MNSLTIDLQNSETLTIGYGEPGQTGSSTPVAVMWAQRELGPHIYPAHLG